MRQVQSDQPSTVVLGQRTTRAGLATTCVWIAALLFVTLNGGLLVLQRSLVPQVRPLRQALQDQSAQLPGSTAMSVQTSPEIRAAVGADQIVDRQYALDGDVVFVHRAAWDSIDAWTPHEPDVCYTANGWNIANQSTVSLPTRPEVQVALRVYEIGGKRVTVAFWYQIGNLTYTERAGARAVRRTLWGQRARPPMIKTLLQTTNGDPGATKLLEFALLLYQRNCAL
jgi:hypothetical protein